MLKILQYAFLCYLKIKTILRQENGASRVVKLVKNLLVQWRRHKICQFNPWVRKRPWRGEWQPTSAFLPGDSHGQRSLVGYNPWGLKELDTTEATQHACMQCLSFFMWTPTVSFSSSEQLCSHPLFVLVIFKYIFMLQA